VNLIVSLLALAALHGAAQSTVAQPDQTRRVLRSDDPSYELTLPSGYATTFPAESPARYVRPSGREDWAKISTIVAPTSGVLKQNPNGITAEEMLPLVSLPPNATWTFSRIPWKNFEVGVIEYRADLNNLRIIGLSTILPLARKALRITVYAPDPLEKELRDDFQVLCSTIAKTETNWFTPEELNKINLMEKVTIAGGVLAVLYPVAWIIFFRGHPLAAHWLRTIWLFAIAVLLFTPITSPGPTSVASNLVVNALLPLMCVTLTIRRLKLGIDAD